MSRILFIDDDPLALKLMQKTASIYGHTALIANSGKTALDMAADELPDLIVVDMQLGDMDGLTVIRELSSDQITAPIPVVMLTAGPADDVGNKAREAGALTCLYKPLHFEALQDILKNPHSLK